MLAASRSLSVALSLVAIQSIAAQSVSLSGGIRMDPDAVKEFKVPWERTTPRDPFVDQQGHVWFVGQMGNYVAMLDPARGEFKRYEIDAGTYPHNLVVDRQNSVWFTGNRNGRIVHLDPQTGKLTTFMIPDTGVHDPHTMSFDAKGDAWFTAQFAGAVGKLTVADGSIRIWHLAKDSDPTESSSMRRAGRGSTNSGRTRSAPSIRRPVSSRSTCSRTIGRARVGSR